MFKSVEECIELFKQGKKPDTDFDWVFNCEEVSFDEDGEYMFNINGDIEAQLKEIREMGEIDVTNGRQIFAEFTQTICPAYREDA